MVGEMERQLLSPRQPEPVIAMSIVKEHFPVERLWELYSYNPLTGELYSHRRKKYLSKKERKQGQEYGRVNFRINGSCYAISMQETIWAWCTGAYSPEGLTVDHEDQIRTNNRIQNLRLATPRQQAQNRANFKGGVIQRKNRWYARIHYDGKLHHLGTFLNEAEAQAAYQLALKELS